MKFNEEKVKQGIILLIEGIGDSPMRPDLLKTPERVAKMYHQILNGYDEIENIKEHITLFSVETKGTFVTVKDVPFYSFCAHHLVNFGGKLYITYRPSGNKVLGLSKLIRIARIFAKKLQTQENLTNEIAESIYKNVPCDGVDVLIEAEHSCMSIRGVRTPGAKTITRRSIGCFEKNAQLRNEAMEMMFKK